MTAFDSHYHLQKLADIYDLDSGWSVDRDFYLSLAGPGKMKILDLGCGTGLLCDAYAAKGHDVTGADPAKAMLDVARKKPHGGKINWIQSPAQDFHSDTKFDLIIMTGHAFQVLMTDDDVAAALAAMRRCISPQGRVVFESRNPAINWAARWDYDVELPFKGGVIREARRFIKMDGPYMTFELRYQFPDEALVSESKLRFMTKAEIEAHLTRAGFKIDTFCGAWDGGTFDEKTSEEMIFISSPA